MTDETEDAFLGGRLQVWQPRRGYRAGNDAVLLASAVPASPGESVLELGCGTGVVLLCLGARVAGLDLTGVEKAVDYAEMARRNCRRNDVAAEILEADALALPPEVTARRFDHVVSNPPFLDRRRGKASEHARREQAVATGASLSDWAAAGFRRVRPGGLLTIIVAAERLPELLEAIGGDGVSVRPICARVGRDADRVLVSARKGARAPFRMTAPFTVHQGLKHLHDKVDDYTAEMRAILRDGAALDATLN